MKNAVVAVFAGAVAVVVVGVAQGMPIEPEPRQFVYQPGSPSVRLYPVHFEHYLKSSSGRVHLLKEGAPILQAFQPNMLQLETGKTERPSNVGGPMTTTMMPKMEMKPMTTTSTTTSTVTTSEPKRLSMTTMVPMTVMEDVTTLQPQAMVEAEEDSAPMEHKDIPSHDLEDTEPVTETVMALEGDSSALPDDGDKPATATETVLLLEGNEVEAATEVSHDNSEATQGREITDDATVTEPVPENEVATEIPNLRELEVF